LACLRSGRDFQLRAAINRRHFNLRAQRGFRNCNRNSYIYIVYVAREDGIGSGANNQIQISGRTAVDPGISFAGQTNSLAVARSRLDAKFRGLCSRDCPLALAGGATLLHLSGAAAAWALDIEFHSPAHLRHLSGAIAFRAYSFATLGCGSVAGRANYLASDLQLQGAPADRRLEVDIHLVFQIAAGLRAGLLLISVKHAGKNIAESSP
jgi:hypothetical protein